MSFPSPEQPTNIIPESKSRPTGFVPVVLKIPENADLEVQRQRQTLQTIFDGINAFGIFANVGLGFPLRKDTVGKAKDTGRKIPYFEQKVREDLPQLAEYMHRLLRQEEGNTGLVSEELAVTSADFYNTTPLQAGIAKYVDPDMYFTDTINIIEIKTTAGLTEAVSLLYGIIHDLKNKIASPAGYMQLINRFYPEKREIAESMVGKFNETFTGFRETVDKSIIRLKAGVNKVENPEQQLTPEEESLLMQKLTTGQVFESINIEAEKTLIVIEGLENHRSVKVSATEVSKELKSREVLWSVESIESLVRNCILNFYDYSESAADPILEINMQPSDDGKSLEVIFKDNGDGLPEEMARNERFSEHYSGSSDNSQVRPKRNFGGKGMGMFDANKRLESLYRGRVWPRRRQDGQKGSEIVVRIPFSL